MIVGELRVSHSSSVTHPGPRACPSPRPLARRGFTLIEMLTVVALLIIVLGLMVSLAWDVRRQSSERVTKDLLVKLNVLMNQYIERNGKRLPRVTPFVGNPSPGQSPAARKAGRAEPRPDERSEQDPAARPADAAIGAIPFRGSDEHLDESALLAAAEFNNRDFVQILRAESAGTLPELFGPLGGTMVDEATLRDAWGTPIVFMPGQHPSIGMALGNRPFFFSAGPDRKFTTLEDNLYSYEQGTSAARGE